MLFAERPIKKFPGEFSELSGVKCPGLEDWLWQRWRRGPPPRSCFRASLPKLLEVSPNQSHVKYYLPSCYSTVSHGPALWDSFLPATVTHSVFAQIKRCESSQRQALALPAKAESGAAWKWNCINRVTRDVQIRDSCCLLTRISCSFSAKCRFDVEKFVDVGRRIDMSPNSSNWRRFHVNTTILVVDLRKKSSYIMDLDKKNDKNDIESMSTRQIIVSQTALRASSKQGQICAQCAFV